MSAPRKSRGWLEWFLFWPFIASMDEKNLMLSMVFQLIGVFYWFGLMMSVLGGVILLMWCIR